MDKKHIISLQGREFVTYEGLLNEAHKRGLVGIRTQLIQAPTEANGNVAIAFAEVTMFEAAAEGQAPIQRIFTGIGDANPRNVNRNIAAHVLRMSETRAKARALRDAVNVGMTAVEELEDAGLPAEIGDAAPSKPSKATTKQQATSQASTVQTPPAELATKAQIDRVSKEMKRTGFTPEQGRAHLVQHYGKSSRLELSQTEIEGFLSFLKGLPAVGTEGGDA